MIFSSSASTPVIAGVGSDKSTTLILRMLLFHKLLGIPLEDMHVFSFTRASTKEFRRKLDDKSLAWEGRVEHQSISSDHRASVQKRVKSVVTTFHSVLLRLSRLLFSQPNKRFFELKASPFIQKMMPTRNRHNRTYLFNPISLTNKRRSSLPMSAYEHAPTYQALIRHLVKE